MYLWVLSDRITWQVSELVAWENSRHFATPPLFFREMTSDKREQNSILMTRHYPNLGSASDWLKQIFHVAWPISASLRSKRFRLVSEQRKTEKRDSRFWPHEKWYKSQKMKVGGGGGEGRKRLQTNPSILKTCVCQRTQRLIGSASRTMLTCVDQRFVSYWEDGMVRDTYINFQWLLFILVGKICPPMQEHFLWPLLKRKALLATK